MARSRRTRDADLLIRQSRGLWLAAVALAVAGCGLVQFPEPRGFAQTVGTHFEGRRVVFEVEPWPFDETVAWLCRRQPDGDVRVVPLPADRGCVRLEVEVGNDALTASIDTTALPREIIRQLGTGPPLFLAVAGERDGVGGSTVIEIITSPIPGDPGPT